MSDWTSRSDTSRAAPALRDLLLQLNTSAGALAAIAAALSARVTGRALAPGLGAHLDEVLGALGVREQLDELSPLERASTLGEIRTLWATSTRLLAAAPPEPGWAPGDAELAQAAGDVSAAFPNLLASRLLPELGGLAERLEADGAAFLDVGAGVAALSIAMARAWPRLRVVGLEPWAPALSIARGHAKGAGVEDRVELRAGVGEALCDEAAFDLAWVPSLFIPEGVISPIFARVFRALRRGGWLIVPAIVPVQAPLVTSVVRLRTALWRGCTLSVDALAERLEASGFSDVRRFPPSPSGVALIAARAG